MAGAAWDWLTARCWCWSGRMASLELTNAASRAIISGNGNRRSQFSGGIRDMLDTTRGIGLEHFLQQLAEAIDWCGTRVLSTDPKACLRTPTLAPQPFAGQSIVEIL